jgi:plastocyanin
MNGKFVTAIATIAVTGAAAIPAAATLGGAHAASSHAVVLRHNRFLPGAVSIRRGDSVTWVWSDGRVMHNVVGHGFQSRVMSHGTFTVRFTRSGTYNYTCTVHAHMNGRVIVH